MKHSIFNKENVLFLVLFGIFLTCALLAEFLGVKIFSLEKSLGMSPIILPIFGLNLSFNLTAGVILWPVVFVLTDVVNEYYGPRGVRAISFLTIGLIALSFVFIQWAINLVPADFWPTSHLPPISDPNYHSTLASMGDYNFAYKKIFGQGIWIIIGSLFAFLIGQLIDVFIFHKIKSAFGPNKIWLRSTGSTIISQLIDSFIVLFIAFYIGAGWSMKTVLAICIVNYLYKFTIAVLLTPLLYLIHAIIERYLGTAMATELRSQSIKDAGYE